MAYETYEPMFSNRMTMRGCVISTLLIFAATAFCTVTGVLVIDNTCATQINAWMPPYPEAEMIREYHNFLRPFAMGVTVVEQHSEDSVETINAWYTAQRFNTEINEDNSIATMLMDVQPAPEGSGSVIRLSTACAMQTTAGLEGF